MLATSFRIVLHAMPFTRVAPKRGHLSSHEHIGSAGKVTFDLHHRPDAISGSLFCNLPELRMDYSAVRQGSVSSPYLHSWRTRFNCSRAGHSSPVSRLGDLASPEANESTFLAGSGS